MGQDVETFLRDGETSYREQQQATIKLYIFIYMCMYICTVNINLKRQQ